MRRVRPTRRRVLLLVLLVAALVEGAIAIAVYAKGNEAPQEQFALLSHPVAGNFKPDKTKLSDCSSNDQPCIQQAFGNIAYYQGPKIALAIFAQRYGDYSDPNCHPVAHRIGSATLARDRGNVSKAFAQGSSACFSGFYHGILERALLSVKSFDAASLAKVGRRLCADPEVRSSRWLTSACTHGLGHGLMITTGYNLPLALKVCDRLGSNADNRSCNGGVFMENLSTTFGVLSHYLRKDDPIYPCDAVARSDKFECYELVTSHVIRALDGDWKKTAETCADIRNGWSVTCFWSFGRDADSQAHYNAAGVQRLCALAAPYHGDAMCLMGASMTTVKNFESGRQAASLCNTISLGLRGSCYYAAGSVMAQYGSTEQTRMRNCAATTGVREYRRQCVRAGNDYYRLNLEQWFLINRRFAQLLGSKGEARALVLAIRSI
ncbi:MAG: hypothetical protein C5B48_07885 [Candidatus Rokuibacteriota bacterium]|nr:MAG: hypothetical protein C5B48_07885 [Candidatus Rokubacteria bacterium]